MTASVVSKRGFAAIMVLLCAVVLSGAAHREGAPAAVTCHVRDDPRGREFVLRAVDPARRASGSLDPQWQLSMRDAESNSGSMNLALPGAKPALTATTAKLSYRNANGGRQVNLEVSACRLPPRRVGGSRARGEHRA